MNFPKKHHLQLISVLILAILVTSCKKYLSVKSDHKLVIPSTLADLQALLDNYSAVNTSNPSCGEVSTGDYYLTDADEMALANEYDRRMYTWRKDYIFATGDNGNDWASCYRAVYFANSVLQDIQVIARDTVNATAWDNIRGQALVHRANRFLGALQVWALAYDAASAGKDQGIPLRLDPDFNEKSIRASVAQGYEQVIGDLKAAVPLLPMVPLSLYRPSKPAAYALLARTFLFMGNYDQAGLYADSCLLLNNQLVDYNTLRAASTYPVPKLNAETIFYASLSTEQPVNNSVAKIDPSLYQLYAANDLRKTLFFKNNTNGTFGFRGNYTAGFSLFGGIATDEMYLIRAESFARKGLVSAALSDLNALLVKRYATGTFVPFTATGAAVALHLVLQERRKELLMRGLRWADIKRLNKEGAGISLSRSVAGTAYTLPANDPRWALPIPEDVIAVSGMTQNPR